MCFQSFQRSKLCKSKETFAINKISQQHCAHYASVSVAEISTVATQQYEFRAEVGNLQGDV